MKLAGAGTGWSGLVEMAQVLGGFATVAGLAAALLSAMLIAVQVWFGRRESRNATAMETQQEYIRLSLEHAEISSSEMMLKYIQRSTFAGILDAEATLKSERALWFLSYMLHTMEQNLASTTIFGISSGNWVRLIQSQLDYHRPLLREVWPAWRGHYGRRFRLFVDRYLAERPDTR